MSVAQATAERSRELLIAATIWTAGVTGAVFLFFFNPSSPSNQFFPQCPFRMVTGWQCPGCGSTRAFYQLLHLHPVAAFKFNPLMVLTLPFLIYLFVLYTRSVVTGAPRPQLRMPNKYLWVWIGLLFVFWVFRNTSWYPFVS